MLIQWYFSEILDDVRIIEVESVSVVVQHIKRNQVWMCEDERVIDH